MLELLSFGDQGWGDELLVGTLLTLRLAFSALFFGLLVGLAVAGMKLSKRAWLRRIANGYTTAIRGVPELLTIFLIYFGAQFALQGLFAAFGYDGAVEVNGFWAGVTALTLVFGAYASEVFRGAFLAIPKGQVEAAKAVGMSPTLTFRRILLPQVWRYALPGLGNLWLVLIKDTSLVSVIALDELLRKTFIAVGVTKEPFFFYGVACLIYLSITTVSTGVIHRLEGWARRGIRQA
jgi:His/Glu/Gln/Arg/opine family amino acid ABC transporter permease subunit